MLIFSIFCLLRATVPALAMDVVSEGKIYKTKPPFQIAGFGKSADEAGRYAGILNLKRQTSATITAINRVVGNFHIKQAYQTTEGWIVNHSRSASQTDLMFDSYIVSTASTWHALETTISAILTDYMRDYAIAFPSMAPKQIKPASDAATTMKTLERICSEDIAGIMNNLPGMLTQEQDFSRDELGMRQAISCYASLQKIYDRLEKEITNNCAQALKKNIPPSKLKNRLEIDMPDIWKNLLDVKAKKENLFAFDARDDRKFNDLCLTKTAQELFDYLTSQTLFFIINTNGAWGGNNCCFESIGQTPNALERVIKHFLPAEAWRTRPQNQTWNGYWPEGGKALRTAILQSFEGETDAALIFEMCAKESHPPSTKENIVTQYKSTSNYLPVWLHDYICRKIPGLNICCFIQPNAVKNVLVEQAEIDTSRIAPNTVYVINRLRSSEQAEISAGGMPRNPGYHYDGLHLVRTGW